MESASPRRVIMRMVRPRITGKPPIDWENNVLPEVKKIIAKYIPTMTKQLTIRQIYYLLVSSGVLYHEKHDYGTFDGKMTEWREGKTAIKKKGKIVGYKDRSVEIDWKVVEDRARETTIYDMGFLNSRHYVDWKIDKLKDMGFYKRMWVHQPKYVEVWVEKDAMFSVFSPICEKYRVPLFPCRGYSSVTLLLEAMERFPDDKDTLILHFGDFDPSGIYATTSMQEKLAYYNHRFFSDSKNLAIKRISLVPKQITHFNLIPNEDLKKAKIDPRFEITQYATRYPFAVANRATEEYKIWELDALEPLTLRKILRIAIKREIRKTIWVQTTHEERNEFSTLKSVWVNSDSEFESLRNSLQSQIP